MSDPQTHLILDIETLSTKPNAVVLSLACVPFQFEVTRSFDEYIKRGFYVKLEVESQFKVGRRAQKETVDWWLMQSAEARLVTKPSDEDVDTRAALAMFSDYVKHIRENDGFDNDCFVWSRGSNFDFPIMESLHDSYQLHPPYSTLSIRDLRTMFDVLTGGTRGQYNPRRGTPRNFLEHNALHDVCMDAIRCNDIFEVMTGE